MKKLVKTGLVTNIEFLGVKCISYKNIGVEYKGPIIKYTKGTNIIYLNKKNKVTGNVTSDEWYKSKLDKGIGIIYKDCILIKYGKHNIYQNLFEKQIEYMNSICEGKLIVSLSDLYNFNIVKAYLQVLKRKEKMSNFFLEKVKSLLKEGTNIDELIQLI